MNLEKRAALVTGAARRVGRAIATELAGAGCDVVVHYHTSRPQAEEVAAEILRLGRRSIAVGADLGEPSSWARLIAAAHDAFGRLDVLVNNASTFSAAGDDTIGTFDPTRWASMLRVNLLGPVGLVHHARALLEADGGGKVVNLCDAGIDRPWPAHLAYCASKAALANATAALARALAPSIQVNGVAPGIAVFPPSYDEDTRRRLIDRVPLGRAGTPEDVARAVRFLVESGDYVTGQIIRVDGGRSVA